VATVRAYYDGLTFVPIEPVYVQKGKVVILTILHEDADDSVVAERLAAFMKLTNDIHELNETEPLPAEYDEILSKRVNFTRALDL